MASLWSWVLAHLSVIAPAVVAVIDLLIAINPAWAANGILHFVLLQAQKLGSSTPPTPPASPAA
jgi:hypothetical protein